MRRGGGVLLFATAAGAATAFVSAQERPTPPAASELPVSVERVRRELEKPAGVVKWNRPIDVPAATFRTRIEQRRYMLTFDEWLKKEFELTDLQRQSANWAAMCCSGVPTLGGAYPISLDPLFDRLAEALERRKIRKINEQIDRELAALEAERKKAARETAR